MKKVTRATIKSFIKKNQKNLYIKVKSNFNGMSDMVEQVKDDFNVIEETIMQPNYTLGIKSLWLVGQSGDLFTKYEDDNYVGYEIYNCCGSQLLVIEK